MNIVDHAKLLLDHNWSDDERVLFKKMIDNLIFYRKLIPKAMKTDIITLLEISNKIKKEYDELKTCTCMCNCQTADIVETPGSDETPDETDDLELEFEMDLEPDLDA